MNDLKTQIESARAEIQRLTGEEYVAIEAQLTGNGTWRFGAYCDGWEWFRGDTIEECVDSFSRDQVAAALMTLESAMALVEVAQKRFNGAVKAKEAQSES